MSNKVIGNFTLVLHAHMPYVLSHGSWPHGTDWLCEAAAETYIPLLDVLNRLVDEGVSPRLVLGMTPVLIEQLNDASFHEEFKEYLKSKVSAAQADRTAFKISAEPRMARLAGMWKEFYSRVYDFFTGKYGEDIVGAFAALQNAGHIEIITSAATHGYLPLLSRDESVRAQIRQAVKVHTRNFGRAPRGIWLPECAYRPGYKWEAPVKAGGVRPYDRKGVEEFLGEEGLSFFVADSHLLGDGCGDWVYGDRPVGAGIQREGFIEGYRAEPDESTKSPYEVYSVSGRTTKSQVAVFARDPKTGFQVWSGEHGYPASGRYLEFHKKRFPGGLRYWEVTDATSGLEGKRRYRPEEAAELVREQAEHFTGLVKDALKRHKDETGAPGLLTAPFDAELFGHWWFEGPEWLYHVLKRFHDDPELELATGTSFLDASKDLGEVRLSEGSWGEGGFHYIWLNELTEWTWRSVYECEARMVALASEFGERNDDALMDILRQAARELLLMQSSDWQFLISTNSAGDYAEKRFREHVADFSRIADMAEKVCRGGMLTRGELNLLEDARKRDRLFEDVDPRWWAGRNSLTRQD